MSARRPAVVAVSRESGVGECVAWGSTFPAICTSASVPRARPPFAFECSMRKFVVAHATRYERSVRVREPRLSV